MKTKYKSLGIIIPSRERIKLLEKVLYSLARSPGSNFLEVIVVSDNCPETFCLAEKFPLQRKFLKYKLITSSKRLYTVGAINFGLQNCDSFLFCWIANDMRINIRDWISYSVHRFENLFYDDIGLMGLTSPGPSSGLTTKKFVEYNDGEAYHKGYKVHFADMEIGIRAVLMGRYAHLGVLNFMKHKGGKDDIPPISSGGAYAMKIEDKKLYGERMKNNFFLDAEKIKNPRANEILDKLKQGFFDWPNILNIPFQ